LSGGSVQPAAKADPQVSSKAKAQECPRIGFSISLKEITIGGEDFARCILAAH
jgi:hypothetical protein